MRPTETPLVERRHRHPASSEVAALSLQLVDQAAGRRWLSVQLERTDPRTLPGVPYSVWLGTRAEAREVWAERVRELRAAGFVPDEALVPATQSAPAPSD